MAKQGSIVKPLPVQDKLARTALKLLSLTLLMFGFGFALVPLYDMLCEITGLNGKTGEQYTATQEMQIDKDRIVTIQFITTNNTHMPWEFKPAISTMKVLPGTTNVTKFSVFNPSNRTIVAQAVPSITPFRAAKYLHKTECFCFEQQELASGESLNMPLRFIIDKSLPEEIHTLTLSYTLYDVTERVPGALAASRLAAADLSSL